MTKLKAKNPEEAALAKPQVLVFGSAGVGKTWTLLDFPATYYIDAEGGANQKEYLAKLKKSGGMYFGQEDGSQDFESVLEQIKALATEKHSYKTLVIDSFSHLQLIEVGKEVEKMMKDKKDMTKTYGAEKKPSASYAKRLVEWVSKLDMTTIIVAHEKQSFVNGEAAGFTADAWDKMEYLFNLVLRVKKTGDTRTASIVKSRFNGFPTGGNFPWAYDEFAARYGKAVLEQESVPLVLATPEQVVELKTLLENWKAPDGWEDKVLTASKCERFEEMTTTQITSTINFIKNKLTGEK